VRRCVFAGALVLAALACSVWQYGHCLSLASRLGDERASLRQYYSQVADIVLAEPGPRHYGLFFYECGSPVWCQVFFDRHVPFEYQTCFMAIHDSYFPGVFGRRSAAEVAAAIIAPLEAHPGALALAYCERTDLAHLPAYLQPRDPMQFSVAVSAALNDHFRRSCHWKAIRRFALAPFRPVYVFRYSILPLSAEEKWRDVLSEARPPQSAEQPGSAARTGRGSPDGPAAGHRCR
jgi:hypothetical protein